MLPKEKMTKLDKKEPDHLAYIDGVRGLAFLGVMTAHVTLTVGLFPCAHLFLAGGFGVQLFFLASAITLCHSMAFRQNVDAFPVLSFYLRRFFRIAPMFWLALVFYSVFPNVMPAFWLGNYSPPGGPPCFYYYLTALFLHGWHPYTFNSIVPGGWSIAVEMTFYSIFPLLFFWWNSLKKAIVAAFLLLIFLKIETHLLAHFKEYLYPGVRISEFGFFMERWFPSQLFVFAVGISIYRFMVSNRIGQDVKNYMLAMCVLCVGLVCRGWMEADYSIWILLLAGIVIGLSGQMLAGIFGTALRYIGKISYSCYLAHFFALGTALKLFGIKLSETNTFFDTGSKLSNLRLFLELFGVTLCLTVIVSTVTLYVVEKPGIWAGKQVIRWISKRFFEKRIVGSGGNSEANPALEPVQN